MEKRSSKGLLESYLNLADKTLGYDYEKNNKHKNIKYLKR
jgi:hypothetical protein